MSDPELQRIEEHYEVLGKLGEGGMGAIYKVRHRLLGEERVVKVMRSHLSQDDEPRDRFLREAVAAVKLRHPNVAQIHDLLLDEDGTAFMVIEFIDGLNLKQIEQQQGLLPIDTVLTIATQALRALGYLHRRGFVHRDVSPDNLMLTEDVDGSPLVKLIDLGIAKALTEGPAASLRTQEGTFLGKLPYASPEQFGVGELDARSDLYSFGIVLYEMLTGVHPILGTDFATLVMGHLHHPPRSFEESDPRSRIPANLRTVIEKALAKDAKDRFQTAEQLSAVLDQIRSGLESPNDATLILPVARPAIDVSDDPTQTLLSEDQITALLAGARSLARLSQFDEAAAQVGVVLRMRPDHPEATELVEEIEQERRRATVRRQALDDALEAISASVEDKDLEGAVLLLEAALVEHEGADELRLLGNEIERRRSAQRGEAADDLLEEGQQLLAAGDLETAFERLGRARELSPTRPGIEDLAAGLEQARQERRELEASRTASQAPGPTGLPKALAALVVLLLLSAATAWLTRGLWLGGAPPAAESPPFLLTENAQERLGGYDFGVPRALLIANDIYPKGLASLRSATSDARQLGQLLEQRYGFTVEVLVDATRYQIMTALERSVRASSESDSLLIFYAGHGLLDPSGNGYWAAYDSEPGTTSAWIPNSEVGDVIRDSVARRVLVIADSCFSGSLVPEPTSSKAVVEPQSLEELDQTLERKARQVLTSGDLQPVADAGSGSNSVFAAALIAGLSQTEGPAVLEAGNLFRRLETRVEEAAGALGLEQQPQFGPLELDQGGLFFFVAADSRPRQSGGEG